MSAFGGKLTPFAQDYFGCARKSVPPWRQPDASGHAMRQAKTTALPDPMRTSAANFAAEQAPKMQQRGGRPLERSCRSLNENVTRAVLIKSCAERSLDDDVKRGPIVMRMQSSPITN